MTEAADGVIKYRPVHTHATFSRALDTVFPPDLPSGRRELERQAWEDRCRQHLAELDKLRTWLHDCRLIGLSDGIGYGNLSLPLTETAFAISGSGTGGARILGEEGYAVVYRVSPAGNEVHSIGPVRASSESMTHAAVYRALAKMHMLLPSHCVIHVHSRKLFEHWLPLAPGTPPEIPYGTPELARAVYDELLRANRPEGFLVLAGHRDGLLFWAPDLTRGKDIVLNAMTFGH